MNRRLVAVSVAAAVLVSCTSSAGPPVSSGAPTSPPPTFAEPAVTLSPTTGEPSATVEVPPTSPATSPPPSTTESAAPTPPDPSGLLAAISALSVAPETTASDYDRELFGGGWIDADGDGCDTRCEVLESERVEIPGGQTGWVSLYDNYSTDDAGELDIDHVVPLAEAWRSGASAWEPPRRAAYANDLDVLTSLIAVTAATNRSKGDRDPAQWQPPNDDGWCAYVGAWVTTKERWALTADPAEIAALTNMATARGC